MALTVSAGAYPAFFTKNYVNRDAIDYGTFTASEMSQIVDRIIDGDPKSRWNSSNATDGTEVSITVTLMEKGANVTRSLDLILFQYINWKNFVVEYSTDGGASWSTVTGGNYASGVANYSSADLQLALAAPLSCNALRVRITHTQTASETKKCGGFIAAGLVMQSSQPMDKFKEKWFENVNVVKLGNGSESREFMMRSAADYRWWGADFSITFATEAEKNTLDGIIAGREPFVFYPEPGDVKRVCYLCWFKKLPEPEYASQVKTNGYLIAGEVREASGA